VYELKLAADHTTRGVDLVNRQLCGLRLRDHCSSEVARCIVNHTILMGLSCARALEPSSDPTEAVAAKAPVALNISRRLSFMIFSPSPMDGEPSPLSELTLMESIQFRAVKLDTARRNVYHLSGLLGIYCHALHRMERVKGVQNSPTAASSARQ
jgi:hypothetical protein